MRGIELCEPIDLPGLTIRILRILRARFHACAYFFNLHTDGLAII